MLDQLIDVAASVLFGILDRFTKLRVGQSLPYHRHARRRQTPTGGSGRQVRAGKIVILMTGTAFLRSHSESDGTAPHVHGMRMPVVALAGIVSLRMAVHAARMLQHGNERGEQRSIIAGNDRIGIGCRFRCRYSTRKPQHSYDDWRGQTHESETDYSARALHTASVIRIGKRRIRFPVAA